MGPFYFRYVNSVIISASALCHTPCPPCLTRASLKSILLRPLLIRFHDFFSGPLEWSCEFPLNVARSVDIPSNSSTLSSWKVWGVLVLHLWRLVLVEGIFFIVVGACPLLSISFVKETLWRLLGGGLDRKKPLFSDSPIIIIHCSFNSIVEVTTQPLCFLLNRFCFLCSSQIELILAWEGLVPSILYCEFLSQFIIVFLFYLHILRIYSTRQ